MKRTTTLSRRGFLKASAAASTLAFPTWIPASALGADGNTAPSERITMGCIGVGSQGTGDMRNFIHCPDAQILAVCDVETVHRERAKQIVDERYENEDCRMYSDFRELLGRGDLDTVLLALPDHWHAIVAVEAAKAGCDIYGEKPLTRSINESKALCQAVQRYGRIWQTGSWQRSVRDFRHACEIVRNGKIGKVLSVEVGLPTGGKTDNHPVKPVPEGLDWEMWLGPAPWRPYCDFGNQRCHWDWRWIMDYSGGQLTDWAGHHIDIAHWGLGFDHTGPIEIEGKGVYPEDGLYNAPMEYSFMCKYANGVTLHVSNRNRGGARWNGENGWVWVDRGGIDASDKELLKDEAIGPNDIRLYKSDDHFQNFLDCVKSRKPTITPCETAKRSITVGHLGEIAMLLGRKIRWNPETEEIVGDPEAAALMGRSYREPWVLG